jgi:hypothetical protein
MHLIAGVANGWRVEFHLLMWRAGEAILRDPPRPGGGRGTSPTGPGLEPNPDVLRDSLES